MQLKSNWFDFPNSYVLIIARIIIGNNVINYRKFVLVSIARKLNKNYREMKFTMYSRFGDEGEYL